MNRRSMVLTELNLMPRWILRGTHQPAHAIASEVEQASTDVQTRAPDRAQAILRMDWSELKQSVRTCSACGLHSARKQAVFGVGDENADWLFIGEGPGAEEDARGEPFVGQAGRLLDNMLTAIGLKRGKDVYIANIVKCRPPGNRAPEPREAAECDPYLRRQIELLRPRLVIALGKSAASSLLSSEASVSSLRGRLHTFAGIPLLVTYHPAYLLRNLVDKAKAWEDLCLARETMQRLKREAHPEALKPG
jgi:DNA polymerase